MQKPLCEGKGGGGGGGGERAPVLTSAQFTGEAEEDGDPEISA